jgi:hypothetical protein
MKGMSFLGYFGGRPRRLLLLVDIRWKESLAKPGVEAETAEREELDDVTFFMTDVRA